MASTSQHTSRRMSYTFEDLEMAVGFMKSGDLTTEECHQIFGIPIKTLRSRRSDKPIARKLGSPKAFSNDEIEQMRGYLSDCEIMKIPRTEQHFVDDVQELSFHNDKKSRFRNQGRPSSWWIQQFKNDEGEIYKFPSKAKVFETVHRPMNLSKWEIECTGLIHLDNNDEYILDKSRYFFLDSNVMDTTSEEFFRLVVMFTGTGRFLKPCLMHIGDAPAFIHKDFAGRMLLETTPDGSLTRKAVLTCLQEILNFATKNKICFPIVVYITPSVAERFDIRCHRLTSTEEMSIICLPQALYTCLRKMEVDIHHFLHIKFQKIRNERFISRGVRPTLLEVPQMLADVFHCLTLKTEVSQLFSKFRLIPKPPKERRATGVCSDATKKKKPKVIRTVIIPEQEKSELDSDHDEGFMELDPTITSIGTQTIESFLSETQSRSTSCQT